jgi:tryptophan synthase alpha chain
MSRLDKKFTDLKNANKKAFVAYIMASDPNSDLTAELLNKLPDNGVDLIELGIPFSDPMAEGPTIQKAAERALKNNCNLETCFTLVHNFRATNNSTPIILMGYFNPIFVYGCENFCKKAKESGVDGVIIVDLPPEEEQEFTKFSSPYHIDLIRLTTPTTNLDRATKILKNASGFVYYVSVAGVTGVKQALSEQVKSSISMLKSATKLPICVGFGIKNAETAIEMSKTGADGIVIGSAFINIIEKNLKTPQNIVSECLNFCKNIRQSIDN